ncbi:hypothetical protein HAX54_044869 [Datura stramonium]|uniref:3'-5' exonuclease domain-containing protein n=1 Tax=Datura stramonium TaxID=4076 RepID=A0ABS8RP78_DATST|nr:hypothetical protein [Datura stramonium]
MDSSYGTGSGTASKYNIKFGGQTIETTVTDKAAVANEWRPVQCSPSIFDPVSVLAKNKWPGRYSRPGLKDLAYEICGLLVVAKHVCQSNWEARVLTNVQVEYACIDAYASYKIGHKLLMEN